MPELPEVETVVNGLKLSVTGKTVQMFREYREKTIGNFTEQSALLPFRIETLQRRGKYIIFRTDKNFLLIAHLRMTGKFIFIASTDFQDEHVRASFVFTDNTMLLFRDVRTFGKIDIINQSDEANYFSNLGVEPLSDDFNPKYLRAVLKNRKAPIKNVLLNQKIIAGLGNIYASEILHRCEINPVKPAYKITKKECDKLLQQTKIVLQEALEKNGTTINDFHNVDYKTGEFQNFLRVYQKKECACGNKIKKIKQAGRSTFFCPVCQQ